MSDDMNASEKKISEEEKFNALKDELLHPDNWEMRLGPSFAEALYYNRWFIKHPGAREVIEEIFADFDGVDWVDFLNYPHSAGLIEFENRRFLDSLGPAYRESEKEWEEIQKSFLKYCDFSLICDNYWWELLVCRPEYAKYCNCWSRIYEDDAERIIEVRPELKQHFEGLKLPKKDLSNVLRIKASEFFADGTTAVDLL